MPRKRSTEALPEGPPFTHPDDARNTTWHGHFAADGSWTDTGNAADYLDALPGSMTRGVRQLVALRRHTELTPREAAGVILDHGLDGGFPNLARWQAIDSGEWAWVQAPASTSAEQAVKSAGMGFLAGRAKP